MREFAEFLELLWNCKFCGYVNRVQLRKPMFGDLPGQEDYEKYKPYSCYHCGSQTHFEFREGRRIERVIRANGDK